MEHMPGLNKRKNCLPPQMVIRNLYIQFADITVYLDNALNSTFDTPPTCQGTLNTCSCQHLPFRPTCSHCGHEASCLIHMEVKSRLV
mmetsp:Transcript_1404/g.3134  ORF Transcript_1404/g.3134 Transcript_1404/m.3134 type:complete len:87 (-) Transcript_1404:800-1060(-)